MSHFGPLSNHSACVAYSPGKTAKDDDETDEEADSAAHSSSYHPANDSSRRNDYQRDFSLSVDEFTDETNEGVSWTKSMITLENPRIDTHTHTRVDTSTSKHQWHM